MIRHVFIGYEPRQTEAYIVARESIRKHIGTQAVVKGLILSDLQQLNLYYRPTRYRLGRLIDDISITEDYNGEMSTEFAISRFFVPYLCPRGWALFVDCDIMVRADLNELFAECEARPDKALMCVQHNYQPSEFSKMDNRQQTSYFRKNWSSVMAFNCDHPAHAQLTIDMLNSVPGRDLHRFCWLKDKEIGTLYPGWNWLAQVYDDWEAADPPTAIKLVHWTLGGPWLDSFYHAPFADEWRALRNKIVRGGESPSRVITSGVLQSAASPKSVEPIYESARDDELPAWLPGGL